MKKIITSGVNKKILNSAEINLPNPVKKVKDPFTVSVCICICDVGNKSIPLISMALFTLSDSKQNAIVDCE